MLRSAHLVILLVMSLMTLGVVMVHSAGVRVQSDAAGDVLSIFYSRHVLFLLGATGVMLLAARVDVRGMLFERSWRNPLWWMMFAALGLCAAALVPGVGRNVNGASRWVVIGGLSFQPSELVKYLLPMVLAWWCARRAGVMHKFFHGLLPALLLTAVAVGLIVIEDLGTAVLIGAVAMGVLLAGGARIWQLLLLVPPMLVAVGAAIVTAPYRMARLLTFLDPWQDPQGNGYHIIQSLTAISQGGVWGAGLGNSTLKFGYLPEDTTDFIFAIICEELGLPGAALVIGLYVALLWVGWCIVRDCRDHFCRLLGFGVLLTLGCQAVMNIAVVTVVVPTKGIALPLVSAGGTGWLVTAAALGLVAALDNARYVEVENDDALLPATG